MAEFAKRLSIKNLSMAKKLTLMTSVVLLLPILSLTYLAQEIRIGTEELRSGSVAIREGSAVVKDQAAILSKLDLANEVVRSFDRLQYWMTDLALSLLNESEEMAEVEREHLSGLLEKFETADAQLVALLRGETEKYYDTMMMAVDAYTDENRVLGNSLVGESRRLAVTTSESLQQFLSKIAASAKEAGHHMVSVNGAIVEKNDQIVAKNTALLRLSIVLPVIASIVGLLLAVVTARLISRPLSIMVGRAKDLANGEADLSKNVDLNREDEVGQLNKWFNLFVEKIRDIITEVGDATSEVANAALHMAEDSEEVCRSMGEQGREISQVSAAIEQMAASVREVADKSGDAVKNADQAGRVAQEGGEVVEQTVQGMEAINEAVKSSADSVERLGERSEQIGEIIQVINDIADQTNLLALNAAIEAARAGEHGLGFAVVADEVRKLADRTTKATSEVGDSIKAIQADTSDAVQRMDIGTDEVKTGVGRAKEAGASLNQIVGQTKEVAKVIQSIAASAEEQSVASEELSRAVSAINAITEKIASKGEGQTANSVRDMVKRSTELQTTLKHFLSGTGK